MNRAADRQRAAGRRHASWQQRAGWPEAGGWATAVGLIMARGRRMAYGERLVRSTYFFARERLSQLQHICKILQASFFSAFLYQFCVLLTHSTAFLYAKLAALSLSVAEVGCEALSFDLTLNLLCFVGKE